MRLDNRKVFRIPGPVNKLFLIGGQSTTDCEVFDSYSRRFSQIKPSIRIPDMFNWYFSAVSIGDYIVIFNSFLVVQLKK